MLHVTFLVNVTLKFCELREQVCYNTLDVFKKLNKDGQMKELKLRQYYQKPSEIKREKKKEGIRRHIKDRKLKALKGEL